MLVSHFILGCSVGVILAFLLLAFICRVFGRIWRRYYSIPFTRTNFYQEIKLSIIPPKFKTQQAPRPFSLRINF